MKSWGSLILALAVLFNAQLGAQTVTQTIRGKVIDAESQVSLPGATVIILDSDPLIGATTDPFGNFAIENVQLGRYDIQASFIGYEPYIMKEVQLGSSKEAVIDFRLQESLTSLDEVVIKAEDNKDAAINTMATVSAKQINMDEARRYAGGMDDPARLASTFAGVSGNLSGNGIVIRGNAPKGLLWRMEGIQISNPNHFANITVFGGGAFTALSTQLMANSDFYTGAYPAEYGNGLSGVFDIKMRNGNNQKREYSFQVGTLGLDVGAEGPFKKGGQSSYLFNYRYSTFALIAPLLPENAGGIKYQDLSFKLNFPTKKAGTFSLWGIGALDFSGQKVNENIDEWEYKKDAEKADSKQDMGVVGFTNKLIIGRSSFLNTSLAASGNGISWDLARQDSMLVLHPVEKVKNDTWKFTLSSYLNHKFSARHTNRSGIIVNHVFYDVLIQAAQKAGEPMTTYANSDGYSTLIQAYSQSKIMLTEKWTLNLGVHTQYFTLNGHYTVEPRAAIRWAFDPKQALSFGYGNHSQLEMIGIYLAEQQGPEGSNMPNKNLDFSRANHFVLGYDLSINENMRFKAELYYQHLYNIPVIDNTSYSMLNLEQEWFINEALLNNGTGTNFGIDLTLERYLHRGFFFLVTGSLFDAKYVGGDQIERSSRFNKGYVANLMVGKEWQLGKRNKSNVVGISGRLNFTGGDRISPVDVEASEIAQDVIYDETRAFEDRKPNVFHFDVSLNYRINKPKHSSIFSIQIINVLGSPEFYGYIYNYENNTIDKDEESILLPSISYRIEF